ncbi:MAG: DoxX family protein [bacterium]|nr:DoxX family protein [bacterium]
MKRCTLCGPGIMNFSLFMLRLAIGAVFIHAGWAKLTGIEGLTGMFTGMGWPAPVFWAWLLALTEFVGGIGVVLGVFSKIFAGLLSIVMIVALLTVHINGPYVEAYAPIALLGATLGLMGVGPGKWALLKKQCMCK